MKKLDKIQLKNALVLEAEEMKRIKGGSGYCDTLWTIIANNPDVLLNSGTCYGAQHGANEAGCSFTINC